MTQSLSNPELLTAIRTLLSQAKTRLQATINHTMVQTYWEVGRLIVEHEKKRTPPRSLWRIAVKTSC